MSTRSIPLTARAVLHIRELEIKRFHDERHPKPPSSTPEFQDRKVHSVPLAELTLQKLIDIAAHNSYNPLHNNDYMIITTGSDLVARARCILFELSLMGKEEMIPYQMAQVIPELDTGHLFQGRLYILNRSEAPFVYVPSTHLLGT